MLMSPTGGWVPGVCAQMTAQVVPVPVAPANSAAAASGWAGVIASFSPEQAQAFKGLDLTQEDARAALIRVLDRTDMPLPQGPVALSDKELPHKMLLKLSGKTFSTLARIDEFSVNPSALLRETTAGLADELADIVKIRSLFDEDTQQCIQIAAALLRKTVIKKAEQIASFKEAEQWGKNIRQDAVPLKTIPASAHQSGLKASKADGPGNESSVYPQQAPGILMEFPENAKSAAAENAQTASSDAEFEKLFQELPAALGISGSSQALEKMSELGWTAERKNRMRELFLATDDPSVRDSLIRLFFNDEAFRFSKASQLLAWLYPDDYAEISQAYPHIVGSVKGFGITLNEFRFSVFADPKLIAAWGGSERRLKSLAPQEGHHGWRHIQTPYDQVYFGFLLPDDPELAFEDGYQWPYPLQMRPRESVQPRPRIAEVSQRFQSIDEHQKLKKHYALFDRIIDSNFQVLGSMSSQADSLTRSGAGLLLRQTRRMADLYHRLRGDSADAAMISRTQKAYERIQEKLRRRWQGLLPEEKLPESPAGLIFKLDPSMPLRSLNSLINWMHQKAIALFGKNQNEGGRDTGAFQSGENSLEYVYVGDEPLYSVLRRSAVLKRLLMNLDQIDISSSDKLFFTENRLQMHAKFGVHTAEIFADLSDPDDGGMLRIRYQDSSVKNGNVPRMKMIAALLERYGMSVQIEGERHMTVLWDKDHGLGSSRALAEAFPFILQFLHSTRDIDLMFQELSDAGTSAVRAEALAREMAGVYLAEGSWPFSYHDGTDEMLQNFWSYKRKEPRRTALREKTDAELKRLGLAPIPEDVGFGQRTVSEFLARPVEEAAARGELKWDGISKPELDLNDDPLDDLVSAVSFNPEEGAILASILETLDEAALDYAPIGMAGALRAERAQLRLDDGAILTVYALRELSSGRLAYARASVWDRRSLKDNIRSWLTAKGLSAMLERSGYSPRPGEALSSSQQERLQALLRSPIPEPSRSEQAQACGVPASPGKGEFSTGPLLFDKKKSREGAILAVPYTSPDDIEAIAQSAAVLTTGGGSLSHAAITTRELGLPSVILSSARWKKEGEKTVLGLRLTRQGEPHRISMVGSGGASAVGAADLSVVQDPILREGDLVRVYGKGGKVALIARAGDEPMQSAYAALEALRSGAAAKLAWDASWGERVERFLLEEALSDPRYSQAAVEIEDALFRKATFISVGELPHHAPENREDAGQAPALDPSLGDSLPELSQVPRPLWSALERRLSNTQDPDKRRRLLEVLRRLLRRTGVAAKQGVNLLFVCTGNTCRSPMAEQITRRLLARSGIQNVNAASRGLMRPASGGGLVAEAARALAELGFTPEPHQVRGLSDEDVRSADVILAMSDSLVGAVVEEHPEAAFKVMLLNRFAGLGDKNINDPMFGPFLPGLKEDWNSPVPNGSGAYHLVAKDILTAVERSMGQIQSFLHLKELGNKVREEALREKMAKEPSFLDLSDIDDDMKPLVGGKSAKLGEMLQALRGKDAYVPEGLALTIYAYKRFLGETGLEDKVRALAIELDAILNAAGMGEASRSKEISRLSERIRQVLMSAKLDAKKGVGKDILEALKKHGFALAKTENEQPVLDSRWSVRSSAIQEDSDDAAFAGAAESYLNLKPEEVLSKVVENWASFWLPRGILYRQRQGLRSVDLLPATLIQKMAPAVVSGVIFTRNPVNGQDEVVINAAYGLGEGVVSGQAAADVYTTRKRDGEELELPHVAKKRWQVETRPEGFGTRLGPVPSELREQRTLSKEQTRRLTRVAAALEKRFGKAMDIEFSLLADGTIVILQARPITTR
ncbi:MAG: PEP/pyruvate-binding domain-containing protein [Elusimicrobiota bacterium]